MEFFTKTGKMALGTRLRLLTAKMTDDAAKIYKLYQIDFSPKWFPVLFILAEEGGKTITDVAEEIGHSQPSVTKIVKEMTTAGLIDTHLKSFDKRRNRVGLTEKGEKISQKIIELQCVDIDHAVEGLINEANHNLWEAVAEWEFLLEQRSLLKRVQEQKKIRESKDVKIVDYQPEY